jgi:hypothetical protein
MTKCPKCGAEIKYIPVGYNIEEIGVVIVDPEYTEIINDGGRLIKGHIRHRCLEKIRVNNTGETLTSLIGAIEPRGKNYG